MKVLIYLEEDRVAPVGGPLGVGYHIKQIVEKEGIDYIHFLPGNLQQKKKEASQKKWLYKHKKLTKIVRSLRHLSEYQRMINHPTDNSDFLNQYDIVHFHRTSDMYKQRESLKKFKGIVLITSHSPIPLAQEFLAASATSFETLYMKRKWDKFVEMDSWSFRNADYIVFPCADAEEPYYLNWEEYKNIHDERKDCYRYVPTGISDISVKKDRELIRKQFNIPEEDFVPVYAGRHNEVKGYDTLKVIGQKYLLNNKDTTFFIAGTEGPIYRLNNPKWIEVGWTKEVHDIISSGDVFILPNKFTYFDLIMIEVLALGKIVIASRTGGNKFFEKAGLRGVLLYDTVDEACELLDKIKKMPKEERAVLGRKNREYFEKHLTNEQYVHNYISLLDEIENEHK